MKKIALMMIALMLMTVSIAIGAEELVTGKITDVVQAVDKNGSNYTRLIVTFDRKIGETEYSVGLPVMGFGEQAELAAKLAVGDTLKAICSKRTYQDRESFTILQILE
jgi:hypothetical protein